MNINRNSTIRQIANRPSVLTLLLMIAFIGLSSSLCAQTWTWVNTTTNGNWSDPNNWDQTTAPNADGAVVILDNYDNMWDGNNHGIVVDGADYFLGDLTPVRTGRGLIVKSGSGGRLVFQDTADGVSTITVGAGVRGMTLIPTVRLTNDLNIVSQGSHSGSPVAMTIGAVTNHTAGVKTITIDSTSTSGVVQNQGNLTGAVRVEHNAPNAVLSMSQWNNSHTGGTAVNAGRMDVGNTALGTGAVELNGGNMRFTRSSAWTAFSGLTEINADATIDSLYAGVQVTLGTLSIATERTLTASGAAAGGNTLVFGNTTLSGNATLNVTAGTSNPNTLRLGVVSDGAADYNLTKTGDGILQLNSANTYSGNTTINGGTLALGASGSIDNSPVINLGTSASQGTLDVSAKTSFSIGASQTLSGYGNVAAGTAAFTIDGTLAPGNSTGIISVTGDTTLGDTSTSAFELAGTGSIAGTDFDQLSVTGTLTFDGDLVVTDLAGYDINQDSIFNLFDAGAYAGNFDSVTVLGSGLTFTDGLWSGSTSGRKLLMDIGTGTLSVVPEPASALLLGLAGLALLRRRR